jgi:uncharacterized protein YndB with AHSA1/START domain
MFMQQGENMAEKTQEGYLVLADISGYTSFLTQAELDHAREIISELLELIARHFKPLLTISKLEGDAIFAYVPAGSVRREETLLEVLETTYQAFRNRIRTSQRLTTCSCRGCKAMPRLDLKFILHYGQYAFQEIAGHRDLVGHDVILVHRLLKNHLADATGWHAYVLLTRQALERMQVDCEAFVRLEETYEHFGTVVTFSSDLGRRYEEYRAARRVYIDAEDSHVTFAVELQAPPVVVWDWLNDPQKRQQWSGVEIRPILRPGGRTKQGAQNHCVHGKSVSVEDIVDWKPFDYFTADVTTPLGIIRTTYTLTETERGSLLEDRSQFFPRIRILKPFAKPILKAISALMVKPEAVYRNLVLALQEERALETAI